MADRADTQVRPYEKPSPIKGEETLRGAGVRGSSFSSPL